MVSHFMVVSYRLRIGLLVAASLVMLAGCGQRPLASASSQAVVATPTPTLPGTAAPSPMEPVTAVPTATPDLTARQVITASIIDDMPYVLGVVVDENNQVVEVENYSAAEAAGIQQGDILDSVDEIAFKAKQEAKNKIKEAKNHQKVKVKLKRNGKAIVLELVPSVPQWPENAPTGTPIPTPQDYF